MPKLTIVIGLPGSGKSHYIEEQKIIPKDNCFDDLMFNSINDSEKFYHSKHYSNLGYRLKQGKDCLIADIVFCKTDRLREAVDLFKAEVPNLEFHFVYFEKNFEQCKLNAQNRGRKNLKNELKDIDKFSRQYEIPSGVEAIKVYVP